MSMSLLFVFLLHLLNGKQAIQYGYDKDLCERTTVHIGGYRTGGSEDAVVMWPKAALKQNTKLPLLVFAHGMVAGGSRAYNGYKAFWNVVCSYGYIIIGPMCCRDLYCQNYYKDVIHTIDVAREQKGKLTPVLDLVNNWNRLGLFGHSMGGAATVHVSSFADKEHIIAAVALHPSTFGDKNKTESSGIQIPMLYFTGNKDILVPSSGVWSSFQQDKSLPKIYAEIDGANHMEPILTRTSYEHTMTALYFDCWIKRNSATCENYFYDTTSPDHICNGEIAMEKCKVVQQNKLTQQTKLSVSFIK